MPSWEAKFEELVTQAAKDVFAAQLNHRSVYLYVVESTPNTWGRLVAVPEVLPPPKDGYLVLPRRLPSDRTVEQLRAYIYQFVRRLPLLPSDPAYRE